VGRPARLAAIFGRSAKNRGIWFDFGGHFMPIFGRQGRKTMMPRRINRAFSGGYLSESPSTLQKIKPNTPKFGRTPQNRCKHTPSVRKRPPVGCQKVVAEYFDTFSCSVLRWTLFR
jgi:hypothetical protein